jgi:hypothetical protein
MKKSEIEVGKTYIAKVSGKLVPVRIVEESRYGGWSAINTASHRAIHIRGSQRLRSECKPVRCGTCDNCRTKNTEKLAFGSQYFDAVNSGPNAQDAMVAIRKAWAARCKELPCTSH